MAQFEVGALFIIVPFAVAVLLGCLFICKHKVNLWRMKKDDTEEPPAQPKLVVAKQGTLDINKYESPSDTEAGIRGAESESDSILEPGKPRKSLCG